MSRVLPKPEQHQDWMGWANALVASLEIEGLQIDSDDFTDGSILAKSIAKDEVVEIDNETESNEAFVGVTGGAANGANYIEVTANGGEMLVIVEAGVLVEAYDDATLGDGPTVDLSIAVANQTQGSGYTTVKTRTVGLQPANPGATIDYKGLGTVTALVLPSDTPNYMKGESVRIRLQATVTYNGTATTCNLTLQAIEYHVIQLQEEL